MPDALTPRDHAERVAMFRAKLIGALALRAVRPRRAGDGAARAGRRVLPAARQ